MSSATSTPAADEGLMLTAEGFESDDYIDIFDGGPILQAHRNALRTVADEVGETCNIATLDGTEVIYLQRVEARWPLRLSLKTQRSPRLAGKRSRSRSSPPAGGGCLHPSDCIGAYRAVRPASDNAVR